MCGLLSPSQDPECKLLQGPSMVLGIREQSSADVAEDLRGQSGGLW